jgi:hypothetical protein
MRTLQFLESLQPHPRLTSVPIMSRIVSYICYLLSGGYYIQALWLSGYSDRLEIYFLREQEFESLRRR